MPLTRSLQHIVSPCLKLCSLNTRSVKCKSADFVDYVTTCGADIFALTETWLTEMDTAHKIEITPPGFQLQDHPRIGRIGGGTAVLLRDNMRINEVTDSEQLRSFEHSEWIIKHGNYAFRLVIIYRPPYSSNHPITTSLFLTEFTTYLESIVLSPEPLLVTGDFNIHMDVAENHDALRLLEILESMGLHQHVNQPTHERGHILDLIITRQCDDLLDGLPTTDYLFSDHFSVLCNLKRAKPTLPVEHVTFRKIKSIDIESFKNDVANTNLCLNSPVNLDELARCYNKTLADVLNRHAPLQTKTVTVRPLIPWFSAEIKASKKLRRKLERTWRYTGSEMDLMNYKTQKNHTNYLMSKARKNFYTNLISENSCNSKKLFNAVNKLLKPHTKSVLPDSITNKNLVNDMGSFFIQKITDIHSKIDNLLPAAENGELCEAEEIRPTVLLECFSPLTEHDVKTLITKGSKKSCPLDPMPTQLVLGCLDNLLPVLTRIINLSLELGEFPTDWKEALIFPLLKKENLDPAVFKNYRPISNLQYISKLTERAVFEQVHKHMTVNSLYPQLQSAYRKKSQYGDSPVKSEK